MYTLRTLRHWLGGLALRLARACGAVGQGTVGQAAVPVNLVNLHRDRRGRFVSPRDPGAALHPALEKAGVTPAMARAASPFAPPADPGDVAGLQESLRGWVLENMDLWLERRVCSPHTVFAALKDSYALRLKEVQLQLAELRLQKLQAAAHAEPRSRGELWSPGTGYWARVLRENGETIGAADCQSAYDERSNRALSHRDAETQSSPVGEGLAPSRSDEIESAAVLTTAGGHKVCPYASIEVLPRASSDSPTFRPSDFPTGGSSLASEISGQAVRCPDLSNPSPEANREPWPVNREPLPAIPRYDPDFDVVANLPKDLVRRYRQMGRGLGNDTQQAKENYYALCKEDCGPYWQQFTPEPKVVQMEDAQQRTYYMAFRDPGDPDPPALSEEEWDWLETGCTGPAPESLSKTHWQPAPGSGAADCQSAYGEQRKEVDSHRGAETQSSSVGEGLAPSRSVEFESAAVLTTAGGHEVRPYASFDTSPEAHREPWPVNREPCSSLAGSISGQAVRCPELSDTSPETRREPWPVYREPCSFPERGPPPQGGGLNRRRYGPGSQ